MATTLYEIRSQDSMPAYAPPIAQDGFQVTSGDGDTFQWTMPSDCNVAVFFCSGVFQVSSTDNVGAPAATPEATNGSEWNPASRSFPFGSTLYFYTPKAAIVSTTFYKVAL